MAVRTQVYLEPEQIKALKTKAARYKTSVSQLIRDGVDHILSRKKDPIKKSDPFFSLIGAIEGRPDDSTSIDTTLYGAGK